MIKCPYCAEEIKEEAKICKHCKSVLDGSNKIDNKEDKDTIEEKIIYQGKAHWSNYIVPIILICTLSLFPIGIYYIYYHKNKKILLTNKKFTYSYGILSKKQLDIKLEKIESIQIKKNLLDMIFGSGTIIVSGTGGNNEPIAGIDNPTELKQAIEDNIHY